MSQLSRMFMIGKIQAKTAAHFFMDTLQQSFKGLCLWSYVLAHFAPHPHLFQMMSNILYFSSGLPESFFLRYLCKVILIVVLFITTIICSLHSSNVLYKTISWPYLSLIFIHLRREPENIVATLGTVVYNILIFRKILFISDRQSNLNQANYDEVKTRLC